MSATQKTTDESAEVEYGDRTSVDQKHGTTATDGYVPGTDEEKRLVRKIDLYLLPTIWLMYLLSYMDRTKCATPYSIQSLCA